MRLSEGGSFVENEKFSVDEAAMTDVFDLDESISGCECFLRTGGSD